MTFRNGLHGGNIGKADAHDDRKPGAQSQGKLPPQREELQERGKRRDHQRRLDKDHLLIGGQSRRAGDNDGRCNAANNHGYHMLHRQGKRAPKRGNPLQFKEVSPEQLLIRHGQQTFLCFSWKL